MHLFTLSSSRPLLLLKAGEFVSKLSQPFLEQPMLGHQLNGKEAQTTDLKKQETTPDGLNSKSSTLEGPQPTDYQQGVDGVGRRQIGQFPFGEQDAFQGHGAGVGQQGAGEPGRQALHLLDDGRAGREEAREEAGDQAGQGGVEPPDPQADDDQTADDLLLSFDVFLGRIIIIMNF